MAKNARGEHSGAKFNPQGLDIGEIVRRIKDSPDFVLFKSNPELLDYRVERRDKLILFSTVVTSAEVYQLSIYPRKPWDFSIEEIPSQLEIEKARLEKLLGTCSDFSLIERGERQSRVRARYDHLNNQSKPQKIFINYWLTAR